MRAMHTIWDEMRQMQEQMDAMFDRFVGGTGAPLLEDASKKEVTKSNYKLPVSDIWETDKEVIAEIEVPGVDKDDIVVNVTDDSIEVKAETKAEAEHGDKKTGMYRFERNYTGFYRRLGLPENTDSEKAKAAYENGVLTVKIPKTKQVKTKKKRLQIK